MFFFKQKTAYEMRISDWSSDVCSSDLIDEIPGIEIVHFLAELQQRRHDPLFAGIFHQSAAMPVDQLARRIGIEPLSLLVDAGDLEALDAFGADQKARRRAGIFDLEMIAQVLLPT